jgi:hypothetical protein
LFAASKKSLLIAKGAKEICVGLNFNGQKEREGKGEKKPEGSSYYEGPSGYQ